MTRQRLFFIFMHTLSLLTLGFHSKIVGNEELSVFIVCEIVRVSIACVATI